MEPIAFYTWQALTLAVQHDRPQMAAELEPLLYDLSWVRTEAGAHAPTLCLTVRQDDHRCRLPPTAREVFRAEGVRGLACGDDDYLTIEASLLRLKMQQGRGEAWLAPTFAAMPISLRRTFWAFGPLKLLRPLGFFSAHAAGVVSGHGDGLLIIGRSGSGKSTLALGLLRQGWSVLSDDAVLLRRQPDGVAALACRKHLYVHAEAATRYADLPLGEEVPDGAGGWKRCIDIETAFPAQQVAGCRPRVLLFSHIVPQPQSVLRPMDGPTALGQLLTHSGPQLFDRRTMRPHLEVLQGLVQQTTAYALQAGRDLYEEPCTLMRLLREAEGAARWPDW
jgi:hypothetical protein